MPFIVLSGPEKSGKTTLCDVLNWRYGAKIRHWGPVDCDSDFLPRLKQDIEAASDPGAIVVWDRSWACESVYAALLRRTDHRSYQYPWYGEWFYGRAISLVGVHAILIGPSDEALIEKRTPDDLPVPVHDERRAYARYAYDYGLPCFTNEHSEDYAERLADTLVRSARVVANRASALRREDPVRPPDWAGPLDANVVFVGEALSNHPGIAGAWLPMSSRYGTELAAAIGPSFTRCAWTNVTADRPEEILQIPFAVALGGLAAAWLKLIGHPNYISAAHPSAMYRWGRYGEQRENYGRTLKQYVDIMTSGSSNGNHSSEVLRRLEAVHR